jgi:hypothetical protein
MRELAGEDDGEHGGADGPAGSLQDVQLRGGVGDLARREHPVGGGHGGHQGQADAGAAGDHDQAEQRIGGPGAEEDERDGGGDAEQTSGQGGRAGAHPVGRAAVR